MISQPIVPALIRSILACGKHTTTKSSDVAKVKSDQRSIKEESTSPNEIPKRTFQQEFWLPSSRLATLSLNRSSFLKQWSLHKLCSPQGWNMILLQYQECNYQYYRNWDLLHNHQKPNMDAFSLSDNCNILLMPVIFF